MVAHVGHLATIRYELRQARKGATVVMDSCAGERRAWAATYFLLFQLFQAISNRVVGPFLG